MSTYTGERASGGTDGANGLLARGLERLLAIELPRSTEFWLYTGLAVVAVLLRFTDLGARALHHDESLHATYAWYLAQGRGYVHDPLMHGPFLFHITALSYLLFGASDASARFPAALLGSAAVMMPLLLRPWLGRVGAFAAAAFVAFSPSILYYSRFIRDDPFLILFTLGLFVAIFRYRDSRHEGWLYAGAAFLMLDFCSMEATYIFSAILLLYLEGALAADFTQRFAARRSLSEGERAGTFLALLPTAWLLALAWPFTRRQRKGWGLDDPDELPATGDLLVLLGLLAAPQFSAAIKVPLKRFGYDLASGGNIFVLNHALSRVEVVGGLTVITLILLTFVLGTYWNLRRWLIAAAVFYIPYFLLYTTFLTNRAGWGSGIWGSLSYWLDQQDVRRGTQPVFYFAMTLASYEYLLIGLAAAGLVIHAVRRGIDNVVLLASAVAMIPILVVVNGAAGNTLTIPFVLAAILLTTAAMTGDRLRQFLIFYFGSVLFALSIAGEKMPWLTEHPALPLALLAGLAVNDAFGLLPLLRGRLATRVWGAVLGVGAVCALATELLVREGSGASLRWAALALIAAALFAGVVLLLRWWRDAGVPSRALLAVGTAAFIGVFGLLTLRADWRLNFVHPDTPDEMLIYTQTSPDIPKVAKQIDQYAMASGQGHNLHITIDGFSSFTWPWAWYLRDYPNTGYPDLSYYVTNPGAIANLQLGSVVAIHASDVSLMAQFSSQYGQGEYVHHRSWFPEGYKTTSTTSFFSKLVHGTELSRWWTYITNRDGFAIPPSSVTSYPRSEEPVGACDQVGGVDSRGVPCLGSEDAYIYFPKGYNPGQTSAIAPPLAAPSAQAAAAAPALSGPRMQGQTLVVGAAGSGAGQFNRPAGMALDAAGNLYVADSKNNRVQKFDVNGNLVATAGTAGSGVTFHEPWGVAVDAAGNVYVADTWNYRIVKLDPGLHLVKTWGTVPTNLASPGPTELYGPRGIIVDSEGNIRVVDTGNARVVTYSPDGAFISAAGTRGSGDGQFQEPTDIALTAGGGFAVADAWNNRVQIFDKAMQYQGQFSVPWVSGDADKTQENKPYLAAMPDGTILVTQPGSGRIVQYDSTGVQVRSLNRLPGMTAPFLDPLGVAVSTAGALYVGDGKADQVARVPIAALP